MANWADLKKAIGDLQASNTALLQALTDAKAAHAAGDTAALQDAFDSIEAEVSKQQDAIHPAIVTAAPEAAPTDTTTPTA